MPINFPSSPTVDQVYTFGSRSWKWTGSAWIAINTSFGPVGPTGPTGTNGLTGPTGSMTLSVNTNSSTSFSLALSDIDKMILCSSATAVSLSVPNNSTVAFPIGSTINIVQYGAGTIVITTASGVTVNATPGNKTRARYSAVSVIKIGLNEWVAFGDLAQ